MERRQDYSPEFREEAMKLMTEQGLSPGEAARRLAIQKGAGQLGCGLQEEGNRQGGRQPHGIGTGAGESLFAQGAGGYDGASTLIHAEKKSHVFSSPWAEKSKERIFQRFPNPCGPCARFSLETVSRYSGALAYTTKSRPRPSSARRR